MFIKNIVVEIITRFISVITRFVCEITRFCLYITRFWEKTGVTRF